MNNKAILYIRVSTEEQVTGGVSLEAQEERLKLYSQMQELEVLEVIKDEGISATKPLATRPGGAKLLRLLNDGKASHVVAFKIDRLFRNSIDALTTIEDWDRKGIALHLVDMGGQTITTKTATGKLFMSLLVAIAEFERNLIAERTSSVLQYKKNRKEIYSPTPYGFQRGGEKLVENKQELNVIKTILSLREKNWSYHKIADFLNRQGIPPKKGKKWYASTVKYICTNNLYHEVIA